MKKQSRHLFIVLKKMIFENIKNKNSPPSPNKFFVFLILVNIVHFITSSNPLTIVSNRVFLLGKQWDEFIMAKNGEKERNRT